MLRPVGHDVVAYRRGGRRAGGGGRAAETQAVKDRRVCRAARRPALALSAIGERH